MGYWSVYNKYPYIMMGVVNSRDEFVDAICELKQPYLVDVNLADEIHSVEVYPIYESNWDKEFFDKDLQCVKKDIVPDDTMYPVSMVYNVNFRNLSWMPCSVMKK